MSEVFDKNGKIISGSGQGGDNRLYAVDIDLLYTGFAVPDNIYDASGDILLITSGNTLDKAQLERINRLNRGKDTINVTKRTRAALQQERADTGFVKLIDLEKSFGYSTHLANIYQLYQDALKNHKINRPVFINISQDLAARIKDTPHDSILSVINAITPKDTFLHRHILNVGLLNGLIGLWLGLKDEQIYKLILTGLLHDLGNALMPQELLYTTREYTIVDYEVIKMHPFRTGELLFDFPDDIRLPASSHHERLDGSGYPRGSIGDEVYGATRITAISDIYEAVVSLRPHRGAKSPFHALSVLDELAHREIDTAIVSVFRENLPKQLLNKPVKLSNGTIGLISGFDPDDIEFPEVEVNGSIMKTKTGLYCVSMYTE